MEIVSLFFDYLDRTAQEQNGTTTIARFNRFSRLAELRLLDYLSGDVEAMKPPEPYNVQKLRDWLTYLGDTDKKSTVDGKTPKPVNYYRFESLAIIGSYLDEVCGKETLVSRGDTPIEILDPAQFDDRCGTWVKDLVPSEKKPIAKMVGGFFEYMPKDLGSVRLNYTRYPVYGEVKAMIDTVYNDVVPDPVNSIDYEWPEFARNILLYFLVQQFQAATRERALTEQNEVINKGERG